MQLALRPYVTTGVALAGAAAIAVSPIVITPQLHLNPTPLAAATANLHLTAVTDDLAEAVNDIIDGFVFSALAGVDIFDSAITLGTPWVQQGVTLGAGLLGSVVSYPFDAASLIGEGFLAAMTDVFGDNPFTAAIASIVNGFIGPEGAGGIIAAALSDAIDTGAGVVNSLIGAGATVLAAAVDIPAGVIDNVVVGFQNALTDLAAGDPQLALTDIVAGFTGATTVVTEGLTQLVNGIAPLFTSLVAAGTSVLNLLVQTPIAAGTAIIDGFINAFTGLTPMAANTVNLNGSVAGNVNGTGGSLSGNVGGTITPLAAASLAGPSLKTSTSANTTLNTSVTPKRTAASLPTLPSLSSQTAVDVHTAITAGPDSTSGNLGGSVSTAASANGAEASAAGSGNASATGQTHRSAHVKAGGSLKATAGAQG